MIWTDNGYETASGRTVVNNAKGDSWWSHTLEGASDLFSNFAGAYLEYERIQHGHDINGTSQTPTVTQPETSSQVNQSAAPMVPGVSNQLLTLAGLGLAAYFLLK